MSESSSKFMQQYPHQPYHNRGGENKFMKKSLSLILVFAMIISMFSSLAFAAEMTAQEKYDSLKAAGIISGFPDGSAGLDQPMTRAQFSVLVSKIYGLDTTKPAVSAYTDVAVTHWGFGFIEAASKAGFFAGTGNNQFSPEKKVTIEELATVYVKALDLALDPDAVVAGTSSWAPKFVKAAIDAGLIDADASFKAAALRSDLVNTSYSVNVIVDETQALTVKTAVASDSTNVKVTLSDDSIKDIVLDTALVSGVETAFSIMLNGVEIKGKVTWSASAALDIASATAVNSKVVAVTLGTAAKAADLNVANVTAKTGTTALVVSSVMAAPYDTGMKTVLVTLAADTAVGTLYSVTSGTKSATFGGKAVDAAKPTVASVTVNDYNEVTVKFSEPIMLTGAVITASEKYGTAAALATSAWAYSGSDSIKFTTADQKAATLYALSISGVTDWAANTMAADSAQTFVGMAKNTAPNTISTITIIDSTTVDVKFAVKVDATTSLDAVNYAVAMKYGALTAIAVSKVVAKAATTDTVTLTLATDTATATLYELTVKAGVKTKYDVATTAALTGTFVGMAKDATALGAPTVASASNTTITLDFGTAPGDSVDAATLATQFTIKEKYGAQVALAVTAISISNDVVTLTTAAQSASLYEATVAAGVKDIKGNATTAALTATFVGQTVAAALGAPTATLSSDEVSLVLTFTGNVGATATDVSHYSISDGVGYPSKAVKTSAMVVTLTIPKTIDGKIYTVTIKGLENSDNVAMAAAGVTATFVGKGLSATKPAIQAAIATDAQTVVIYFDRAIADSTISGATRILNGTVLVVGAIKYSTDGTAPTLDLEALTEYAWVDPANANALMVRVSGETFKTATGGSVLKLLGATAKVTNTAALDFAPNTTAVTKPSISAVLANNNMTLTVYFSENVTGVGTSDFAINSLAAGGGTAGPSVTSAIKVDDKTYQLGLGAALASQSYYLRVVEVSGNDPDATIDLITSLSQATIELAATNGETASAAADYTAIQFAGTATAPAGITSVYGLMTDKRTIEVYYPEAMDATTATRLDEYAITTLATGLTANLTTAQPVISADINSDGTQVTLHLGADIDTGATNVFLVVTSLVKNKVLSNGVKADKTGLTAPVSATDTGVVVEFAKSATAATAAKIASVSLSDDRMGMTITMNEAVAFEGTTTPTLTLDAGAGALDDEFPFSGTLDTDTAFTIGDFNNVFTINGMLVGDTAASNLTATEAIAGTLDIRQIDGKTFKVTFPRALKPSTNGYVTTENAGAIYMFNRSNVQSSKANADASKVTFGVPATSLYDTTAPAFVSATYLDATGNGEIDKIELVFTKEILASSVALADFTFAAANALTSANIDADDVAVSGNKITITIDADVAADNLTSASDTLAWVASAFTDTVGNNIALRNAAVMTDGAVAVVVTGAGTKTLSATSAQITFSEVITIATPPAVGRFAGAAGNVTDVTTPPSGSGTAVITLTFPAATFATTAASVIDYTALGSGNVANLKDAAGLEVVSFTDKVLATGF